MSCSALRVSPNRVSTSASTASSQGHGPAAGELPCGADLVACLRCPLRFAQPPVPQHAAADAENGRGLMLVSQLSHEWGYYPANRGKVVYCFLHTPEFRQAG